MFVRVASAEFMTQSFQPTDQLEDAVERLRTVIGDESSTGIPDSFIKDVVWNNYFDEEQSISDLLGALSLYALEHPFVDMCFRGSRETSSSKRTER